MFNFVYRKSNISHDEQQKLNKALVQLVCMAILPFVNIDKWPLRDLLFIANQDYIVSSSTKLKYLVIKVSVDVETLLMKEISIT